MASLSPLPARTGGRSRSGTLRPPVPSRRAPEPPLSARSFSAGTRSVSPASPSPASSASGSAPASPLPASSYRRPASSPASSAAGVLGYRRPTSASSSSSRFARLPPSPYLDAHSHSRAASPDARATPATPPSKRRTSGASSGTANGARGTAEDSSSETENEGFEDAQSVDVYADEDSHSVGAPSSATSHASNLSELGAGPRAPSAAAAAQRKKERRVSLAAELAMADTSTEMEEKEKEDREKAEREEEEQVRQDMADLDLSKLPPPPSHDDADDAHPAAAAASAASTESRPALPVRTATLSPLEGRKSLWERLRSASGDTPSPGGSSSASGGGASPAASPSLASPSGGGVPASRPAAPSKRPTFGALPSFSSLAAAAAAGLGARRASETSTQEAVERQRLPRFGVNESQLAEDAMRFIDARDVLYNEKDPERIRELGMRLESGWREKLQEISLLHSKLEALQHALSDVEDENATLRTSISALSEQVASLECAFDSFQHATIEQMRRERELWSEERREELERVLYAAAAARREAEAAKAVVAQLRLVLLGAGMRGDVDIAGIERAIEALSKGLPSDADEPASATPSGASENDEEAQERRMASAMLFDVPLSPGAESRRQSMLFDQPVSLAHLRLLGLAPPSDGATPSSPSSSSTDRTSLASLPPTPLSSTPSHAALETLARRKEAADEALARALREENERLRTQMKERERRLASAQKEVETLKERVRDTEAAVEGLFAAV
ncbi:hypothetical protein FA09DRAFT_327054 [Tilletiopsis washingtonensis]|uniref:Uncharacterized protein n=1 Tax=Tilletiopsis washingtonensis TaxID=58919 RepID=A0A316ZHW0_9BASI|nr:hypothetical protein FA09DRAFT_327054 [Tilletiopsis washingtonensis]PWO01090.1 hypothetical protein FA09DRAFT_327054 [Tilletiopsis washingtonensis]